MRQPVYLDDHLTLAGYIAPQPGLFDEPLRFIYRPALTAERSRLIDGAAGQSAEAYDRRAAELMADKLLSWNVQGAASQAVAISADALLRVQPEAFIKLHRIVFGWIASDVDPEWPAEQTAEQRALEREAVKSGRTIGELREERHEKN